MTNPRHRSLTIRLLCESLLVAALLAALALALDPQPGRLARGALLVVVVLQGFWLHRLYVVAHEASHGKLWPDRPTSPGTAKRARTEAAGRVRAVSMGVLTINDALGQLLLLPLMLPLRIHRKIHAFHHGHNRRDHDTSALDTFVIARRSSPGARVLARAWCHLVWYLAVFAGGFFVHSLVSVAAFLAMPLSIARRISPAFRGWTHDDQLRSLAAFGLHLGVAGVFGTRVWALTLGWPLVAFAWVYSLLVYIYHYDTDYGPQVRFHVRGLRRSPLLAWWLLNFNEHATHHRAPKLCWYELPEHGEPLPPAHADNQKIETIGAAILYQLRGPRIIERPMTKPGEST
jgi:fatty acid desaturase